MKKTIGCCLSTLLTLIVLVVAVVFGGSYFVYAQYGKPLLGISYWDAMGLLPGLYKGNEKKIVTQPFDEISDREMFNNKMKAAMFMREDSEFDLSSIISEMLGSVVAPPQQTSDREAATVANNEFLILMDNVHFDFSTLKDFDNNADKESKGVFTANNKEIGAFISNVFDKTVLPLIDSKVNFGVNIGDVLNVKQVIIDNADAEDKDIRLAVTIGVEVKKLLVGIMNNGGLKKYSTLIANVLPKKLFFTATIAPYDSEVLPKIVLNQYSDKKMATIMTALNNVMNSVNKTSGEDVVGKMFNLVDSKVKAAFNAVHKYAKVDFTGNTTNIDVVQLMMTTLKLNSVTKVDFLTMLSYLFYRDVTALDALKYDETAVDTFFVNFSSTYAVKNDYDINKNNFTTQLMNIHNNIDTSKINFETTNDTLKAKGMMTYDALAALFESTMIGGGATGGEEQPPAESEAQGVSVSSSLFSVAKLREISMDSAIVNIEKQRLRMVVELPFATTLKGLLGDSAVVNFVTKILPEKMFITAEINLNNEPLLDDNGNPVLSALGEPVRKYPLDPSILINDLNIEQSTMMMNTLSAILKPLIGANTADQFGYDTLRNMIGLLVSQGIEKIEKSAGGLDITFNQHGMMMPTMYELVGAAFNLKSDIIPEDEMPDEVRKAMKGVQETEKNKFDANIMYGSNDTHNAGVLAEFVDRENLDIQPVKLENANEPGSFNYYFTADTEMPIHDKIVNQSLHGTDVGNSTAKIKLLQTMFVNTNTESEVLENEFFKKIVAESGFKGDLVIQTVEMNLTMNIDNPIVPKSLYITYVLDSKAVGEENNLYIVINGMDAKSTAVLEGIINSTKSTEDAKFDFHKTIHDAIMQYKQREIVINLPQVNWIVGDKTITIKISPIKITLEEILNNSSVQNVPKDLAEYEEKGTGKFVYNTTAEKIDFTTAVMENQELKDALDIYFALQGKGRLLPLMPMAA